MNTKIRAHLVRECVHISRTLGDHKWLLNSSNFSLACNSKWALPSSLLISFQIFIYGYKWRVNITYSVESWVEHWVLLEEGWLLNLIK
jgi:hypothetical protein